MSQVIGPTGTEERLTDIRRNDTRPSGDFSNLVFAALAREIRDLHRTANMNKAHESW